MTALVRTPHTARRKPARAAAAVLLILSSASAAWAQTRGAELIHEQKPAYPDTLSKGNAQGNVILIARIDKKGTIQDVRPVWASLGPFVEPTLKAVKAWTFRPALKEGQPIDIAANVVFPFRIRDTKGKAVGREIPGPALHDLAVFPADASGRKTAPEGFPIRKGADARLRVEASLDLPSAPAARQLTIRIEAVSPGRKRLPVFEDKLSVAAKAIEAKLPFSIPVAQDWEDGVWMLRFSADGADLGGGQFWIARDPERFDFAAALRSLVP